MGGNGRVVVVGELGVGYCGTDQLQGLAEFGFCQHLLGAQQILNSLSA